MDATNSREEKRRAYDERTEAARIGAELMDATNIKIEWQDGLQHHWIRQRNGTWNLKLTDPVLGTTVLSGYRRGDMERVIGTALHGTPEGDTLGERLQRRT